MFGFFKKKKKIHFSEVLDKMKDEIVTHPMNCHFYYNRHWKIYEWQLDLPMYVGDEIEVVEYYTIDNVLFRNNFKHIVS